MTEQAVIVDYVRSPFTLATKGALARVRSDELVSQVIKGLIARHDIDKNHIEDLLLGCAFPEGEQGLNLGRIVTFLSDLPITVAGATTNRFCGSSMETLHSAAGKIAIGAGELFIVAGTESMSRIPMTGFNPLPHPGLFDSKPEVYEAMGITAENLAKQYKIKRKDQEEFAFVSHCKASKAAKEGRFEQEIIPINTGNETIAEDGCIRHDVDLASMENLAPAFDAKGSVTAATSSPLTDGAVALLVCAESYADKYGLHKLARIRSAAVSGCAPEIMGIGPVGAAKKALNRAGLSLKEMDVIELNEAFAAQSMAVVKELGVDMKKLNLDGGAIAMGHPLGASGARISGKAASLLDQQHGQYALAMMCIGGGQGIATVLEAI